MASKAIDSTNNIDVRKFCIDLMPEINQPFTILFPFRCSCRLGEHLAPQFPGREWDPLEGLVFYSYWIWSPWKLQGINFTVKKKFLSARKCQNSSGHCFWNGLIYRTFWLRLSCNLLWLLQANGRGWQPGLPAKIESKCNSGSLHIPFVQVTFPGLCSQANYLRNRQL